MYIKVKLVFRFPFVGHEFRQGPVFRMCVMEKMENKALFFLSNTLNFTVVWHKKSTIMIFNLDCTRLVVSFKKYMGTKNIVKTAKIQIFLVVTPTACRSIFLNPCSIQPIEPNIFTLQNHCTLI